MKTTSILTITLLIILGTGCSRTENDFVFHPGPYVKPPPPPPPPPPNPKDRFITTEPYPAVPNFSYSMITDDGFGTISQTTGNVPITANPYNKNMEIVFVIAPSVYKVRLPLNSQTGSLDPGKYTISDNTPGTLAPVSFDMPGGRYPEHNSNYSFSFSLEITAVDKEQHKISGVLETMAWKQHIFDDLYTSEKVSSQPFVADYNYCEVIINGKKEMVEPFNTNQMMEQQYFGGLQAITAQYPGNRAVLAGPTPFWTESLIGQYIAGKGLGNFVKDYAEIRPDSAKNLPPIGYALNERTRIYPSDLLTLHIEKFNSYQFIQGSIDFRAKAISDWSDENKLRFDPGSPRYDVKINFRYLLLAD